ncbi:MAG: DUF488 family protein [Pseudonocardiales bacterium]
MTRQARIEVARVYEPRSSDAECRVLIDRLWPRGLTTVAADLDNWCRDVAPSTSLRRWYAHRAARFSEFRERYLTELDDPTHIEAMLRLQAITGGEHLILLTAVRDLNASHAAILAERLCWGQARHMPMLTHVHIHQ